MSGRIQDLYLRRRRRVRAKVRKVAGARLRLTVFRSNQHIYAQIINDRQGRTLAAASSLDKAVKTSVGKGSNIDAAKAVGAEIAKRATAAAVKDIVFDRGGYLYHGRVKALAEAAREGGLSF